MCLLFWLLGISSLVAFLSAFSLDQTHTHTHTHINTGDTSTHVYTIIGLIQRHKLDTGNTGVSGAEGTVSSTVGDGVRGHHVLPWELPVYLLPEHFRIFGRQPEAASSAAGVVVVRCRLVDVEIHRRSQSQHTGALGHWTGCPFNDRLSQGKGRECKAQAILNSLSNRRLGNGLTHGRKILTKILNSSRF